MTVPARKLEWKLVCFPALQFMIAPMRSGKPWTKKEAEKEGMRQRRKRRWKELR